MELGRGATGIVWEAYDRKTTRLVAVKIMPALGPASVMARMRFLRAASTLGQIRHPHIVAVFDHGEDDDGRAYLVMERLLGPTLAAHVRGHGPLCQTQTMHIGAQILEAVSATHRQNIVHRDLKPENVMLVTHEGRGDLVKVCDFDLATPLDLDNQEAPRRKICGGPYFEGVTFDDGQICGTPAYMSPEQSRGDTLDGRADLYSVAVILYYLLVGRLPFEGCSRMAVLSMQLSACAPRPSVVRPDLRIFPPLESLILRGLSKDPAERPCSADVFRFDLLQIKLDYLRRIGTGRGAVTQGGDAKTVPAARWRRRLVSGPLAAGTMMALLGLTVRGAETRHPVTITPAAVSRTPASSPTIAGPSVSVSVSVSVSASASTLTLAHPKVSEPHQAAATVIRLKAQRRAAPRRNAERSVLVSTTFAVEGPTELTAAEDLLTTGAVADACALGRIAAVKAPRLPAVWEFLGRCYMRLPAPEAARGYYRRYLALDPPTVSALFVKAIVDRDLR